MGQWKIEYWAKERSKNPIDKWLDSLAHDQLKSIAKEVRMLEQAGSDLKLPHSKALGKGLFELRERRYGYRIYYGFSRDFIIILLAAGDKKSQENDIKTARKRLLEL
jgi:putative addiction module killer protein